jgi:hypothetical protein
VAVAWRRTERFGHPEVFAGIAALSFLAARFLPVLAVPWTCPVKAWTGLPCATCGMTHAFVALARGEVSAALAASPLGALLAGGAWLYGALDLARAAAGAPWPDLGERAWRWIAAAAMVAVAANWAWLVARTAS